MNVFMLTFLGPDGHEWTGFCFSSKESITDFRTWFFENHGCWVTTEDKEDIFVDTDKLISVE